MRWSSTPTLSRTRVGRYNRTTIPREVRKLPGISESDVVEWVFEDGRIYVRRGGKSG
jgi:bifunctional DNA-binding transcriptional regulator/antitoxin component of YhaV-PrlF toxin-antitoxin module